MSVDRRALNVLLAVVDIEQRELADIMGYRRGYITNILNGFTKASPAFRDAFGRAITELIFGPDDGGSRKLPAGPLVEALEQRAKSAGCKDRFYENLGLRRRDWLHRAFVSEELVDRICCKLGVHPSDVYGREYYEGIAS